MAEQDKEIVGLRLLAWNSRIRAARKEKGFTQADLSQLAGINLDFLSQIERLRIIPSPEIMEEIAAALEKPVNSLFPPELLEAIKEGVFYERKAQIGARQLITLTEAKKLGLLRGSLTATSGEEVEEGAVSSSLKKEIGIILSHLSPIDQKILTLRFNLDGGGERTLEETGQALLATGLFKAHKGPGERARQVEMRALKRILRPSRNRGLKDFVV